MNIKRCLFVLMFFTLFLCACSNKEDPNLGSTASSGITYATNISLSVNPTTYYVGESLNLETVTVSVTPNNATVKPSFSIDNVLIANLNNNVLTFIAEGSVNLTASILTDVNTYKTSTVTLIVTNRPVYASTIETIDSDVVLNFDETKTNEISITPSDYNNVVNVEYLNGDIVKYDYETGLITPLEPGEDVVTITVYTSETETISTSFNVAVTDYVYASNLGDFKLNNKELPDFITLFTNETGTLSCEVLPENYNMGVSYSCSNNLISVSNNGDIVVGNISGSCELICSVNTKDGVITKAVNVNVVNVPTSISFDVKSNNNVVDYLYAGTTYNAYISTVLEDYSELTFLNCNYDFVSDNVFEIVVSNATETEIKAVYNLSSFIGSYTIYGTKTLQVYNVVEDVNFALVNTTELIPNNNVYTLYLPNLEYLDDAVSDGECVYADITLSSKNINTLPNCLSVNIEGDSVNLVGNKLIAAKLGESKLIISASDIGNFNKEVTINVVPLEVSSITTETTVVNLYLNGSNDQPNSFNLEYVAEPHYAYNTSVIVECNSDVVSIEGNVVTALKAGNATITLKCGNITKQISVVVVCVPTHISVLINGDEVTNNAVVDVDLNTSCYLTAYVYSNTVVLDNEIKYFVNDEEYDASAINKLTFTSEGEYSLKLESGSLTFECTLKVNLVNPITALSFELSELNVNMFESANYTLSYEITKTYPTKEHTSQVVFVSSNENVVTISGSTLQFVGVGTATIRAMVDSVEMDTLTVNVVNKEVNYVSSVADFIAIKSNPDKEYVVTTNLDFATFTAQDSFDFSGKIDFSGNKITNLKTTLFKTISQDAVVTNLVVSGTVNLDVADYYDSSLNASAVFTFIANENNGTISNISFDNFTFNLTKSNSVTSTTLSLITLSNNGVITNVSLNNFVFNAQFKSEIVGGVNYCGLVQVNEGVIAGVTGSATYSGFTKISGIALNNYSSVSGVTLTQTFNCTQSKHQIGALIYKCYALENGSLIENINLTTIVNNTETLSFAGFIYNSENTFAENIKLNNEFKGTFDNAKPFLVYYSKPSSVDHVNSFEIVGDLSYDKYS